MATKIYWDMLLENYIKRMRGDTFLAIKLDGKFVFNGKRRNFIKAKREKYGQFIVVKSVGYFDHLEITIKGQQAETPGGVQP